MLALTRRVRRGETLASNNCLVLDCPDGGRVRIWLLEKPGCGGSQVKVVIDAPDAVTIRRGEHLDDEGGCADGPREA